MRWVLPLLFALAALTAGWAATRLRSYLDRRGTPAPTAQVPDFTDAAAARRFADAHPNSAAGARALWLWARAATGEAQREARRAVFRARYPRSWVVRAWEAQSR